MRRKYTGQEAIEFALIGGLVFFVGIGTIVIFGEKIAKFFEQDSAVIAAAKKETPVISKDSMQNFTPNYQTEIPYIEEIVGGEKINIYDDGNIVVNIDGTAFRLNPKAVAVMNTIMETNEAAGSSGLEDLIREVAYLARTYNVEPEEVEVWNGSGNRNVEISYDEEDSGALGGLFAGGVDHNAGTSTAEGDAKFENTIVNAFVLKVGDHIIIIQKDQDCNAKFCPYQGTYRVEGDVDENGNYNAAVRGRANDGTTIDGSYSTTVDFSNGISFEQGFYDQGQAYESCTTKKVDAGWFQKKKKTFCDKSASTGTWSLDFSNTSLKFGL